MYRILPVCKYLPQFRRNYT